MENKLGNQRVQSLDVLKGIILLLMALDHTRDYFHESAFIFFPLDPEQTNWPTYLTRWITHFCAPTFSLLAGISAFFVSKKKSNGELSVFLFKRGLWLIIIEQTLLQFAWNFNPKMNWVDLGVISSLGISMIFLGILVHARQGFILVFSLALIFGHNLLDFMDSSEGVLWAIIHKQSIHKINDYYIFSIGYPLIPWIGVMSLGYWMGSYFYHSTYEPDRRKNTLSQLGLASIGLFLLLRIFNIYGNPTDWMSYDEMSKTMMSFFDVNKYPPSLDYLLITLGPALLFMAYSEKAKGRVIEFIKLFGRVPFFYYILHLYLIHLLALLAAEITWDGWQTMIIEAWVSDSPELEGYGFSLGTTYLIWGLIITLLYPMCKAFDRYKQSHKEKEWLSYF